MDRRTKLGLGSNLPPRHAVMRELVEMARGRKGATDAPGILQHPLRLWSGMMKQHVESGSYRFAPPSLQAISIAYDRATGKGIPIITPFPVADLPRIARMMGDAKSLNRTVVNPLGFALWVDPFDRERALIPTLQAPDPGREAGRRRIEELLRIHLASPLAARLQAAGVPPGATLERATETITAAFYLLFVSAVENDRMRAEALAPFVEVFVNGAIPVGEGRTSGDGRAALNVIVG